MSSPSVVRVYRAASAVIVALILSSFAGYNVAPVGAASDSIVISQVYGGGGNSGATLKNDFIELFNRGTDAVSLSGWSVQYASAAGSTWQVTSLTNVSLQAGQYYLIQEAAGAGGTTALPTPDAFGAIAMSATAAKVALVNNTAALTGACPVGPAIVDLVGYGAASCAEGTSTPALSNTTAALRKADGVTDSDDNANDFTVGAPNPRNSSSMVTRPPTAIPLAIHDIQGHGSTSPYVGQLVSTQGVVTGIKTNGFFLQARDLEIDSDANTSEGIFVFTGSLPPPAAGVGNYVDVTGAVQEFVPSQDPQSPPTTEIGGSPTVTLLASGFPLPSAVALTAPDTPASGGLDVLERLEGMRVSIASLTVVAPTQGTISEANATSASNGVFYGVITGIARPMREPGVPLPDPLPAGAPAGVPRYDGNPERIRVDSDALVGAPKLEVTTGAIVTDLVGPLDYSFRTYMIDPDPATPPSVSGNIAAIPVDAPTAREFTVASFNMERFFDTTNDPTIQEPVLTAAAFATRLNKASLAIRRVLHAPDVIGVEEMENLPTLQELAAKVNADAVASGEPNPDYQAYLIEGNDIGGIDVGALVKAGRVTVNAVQQIGIGATYINPLNGLPELLNDRPTLRVDADVHVAGAAFPITILVNHLRSLSGIDDPGDGARVRAKRRAQAEFLASHVQSLQSADANRRLLLLGDFNAFQFNDGYVDVIGTIEGAPAPADQVVLASPDLVEPNLIDLVDRVPPADAYSFVFDGTAQELDHVLVTQNLIRFVTRFEYARNNADFPESYRADASRPERISDHDMVVVYVEPDATPPAIVSVAPDIPSLWPLNKRMVPVTIAAAATDAIDPDPQCVVGSVTSNEGTAGDYVITGPSTVSMRATRNGNGAGRIYTIGVTCTDASGNTSKAMTNVVIPHDHRK